MCRTCNSLFLKKIKMSFKYITQKSFINSLRIYLCKLDTWSTRSLNRKTSSNIRNARNECETSFFTHFSFLCEFDCKRLSNRFWWKSDNFSINSAFELLTIKNDDFFELFCWNLDNSHTIAIFHFFRNKKHWCFNRIYRVFNDIAKQRVVEI
jgi:hypothetical protein